MWFFSSPPPENLLVKLNVYDLHDGNNMLHSIGAGFYHSGIEVNGYEYSFSPSGVSRTSPRLPVFGTFREQIVIGEIQGGMTTFNTALNSIRRRFEPGAYHIVSLNCNHFTDALCWELFQQHIPEWINRVARVGSSLLGSAAGSSSKEEVFAAPGVPKSNKLTVEESSTASTGVLSWFTSSGKKAEGENATTVTTVTTTVGKNASKKKELTEKQKELLAKIKNK